MTYIIKSSGEKEKFDKRKIENSLIKAGAGKKLAEDISEKVRKKIHKGAKTKEIINLTEEILKKEPVIKIRYNLKNAIMNLGPSGFAFEEFFSQILRNYGYKTKVGKILMGKNITHEVDIVAKNKKSYMIECKYHNLSGIYTRVKVSLYTYARFLDLRNNREKRFDYPWLSTNTKTSSDVIKYAKGVGMKITSWKYPRGESLQDLIMEKGLYPITILPSVRGFIKEILSREKIVIAKELTEIKFDELYRKTKIPKEKIKKIVSEAGEVCLNNLKNKNK